MVINTVSNKAKYKSARYISAAVLSILLIFAFIPLFNCNTAEAETVTDTLTIKIGYWGMSEEDYVEKATYHWTELNKKLSIVTKDYSFFKGKENGTYSTVVASGRGFYLSDLLSYANVNTSDMQNISFYTNDYSAGSFTSFTPYQILEQPRYYYDNLASHITNKYNDAGILVGYKMDDSAESHKKQVRTMLALESNWNEFEAGTQNTNPNHSSMSTSSRFRLLFGQTKANETNRTGQSAKYVHTIAVTIPGSPVAKGSNKAGNGKIILSNKVGKHKTRFNVASDQAMVRTIMKNVTWTSTDETVLKIRNVSMRQSSKYNDAVEVTIDYEVLKKGGKASINGDFMGLDISGSSIETGDNPTDEVEDNKQKDKDKPTDDNKGDDKGNGGSGDKGDKGGSGDDDEGGYSLVDKGGKTSDKTGQLTGKSQSDDSNSMYAMDLNDVMDPDVEDTKIVKKDRSGEYLPGLCIGAGALLVTGGAFSVLQFKSQTGGLRLWKRKNV